MSRLPESVEERELRAVARRYRRSGYRVTIPRQSAAAPAFLEGYTPDLIAESEADHVVVEIKRAHALLGSNELREIAERVSREPGWRFELVTVRSVERPSPPDVERMDQIAEEIRRVMNAGLNDLAYISAWTIIEVLLNDLAIHIGLDPNKSSVAETARTLVNQGVIISDTLRAVEQAYKLRNQLVHAEKKPRPSKADVEKVLTLGQALQLELMRAAAE